MAQGVDEFRVLGGRLPPSSAVRVVGDGRAQRQPAKARLESRRVRGRENRRVSDVFPESPVAAQRRNRQCRTAPTQAGRIQSSAAQNRQVSTSEYT